ncbi:MAG: UDP-galactopyranose mutase [Bacilli bacterium]
MKAVIIGAGLSGIVIANLLSQHVESIDIYDKRYHIGGNCYDYLQDGVLTHRYGAHLFHTNIEEVFLYLSQFTGWHDYKHVVKVDLNHEYYDMPINRSTINKFFNINLQTEQEVKDFLDSKRLHIEPTNAEEQVLSLVGKELYEAFFKEYTKKQWNKDPKDLDKSITARIPVRYDDNSFYFDDVHQCMPKDGFTAMFKKMLRKPNIHVHLNTNMLKSDMQHLENDEKTIIIWTGKVDEYFNYSFGELEYRSLKFEFTTYKKRYYQDYAVVNYTGSQPYTRILEMKHATGQNINNTVIVKEYPADKGESYYPVINKRNSEILEKYQHLERPKNVYFLGRLGGYKYINMDQSVANAIELFKQIKEEQSL